MANSTKASEIDELLSRGVSSLVDPDGSFKKKITSDPKKVVIKFGVDPTRPDIHLGHAVVLRKLRKFQDLGAKVIFLVGDFTSLIGDPSGASKTRPEIEQKEVEENMKTYLDQVGKILKTEKEVFSWIRNSDWFYSVSDIADDPNKKVEINLEEGGKSLKASLPGNDLIAKSVIFRESRMQKNIVGNGLIWSLTIRGLIWTLRHITFSRLVDRDMFQERIKGGGELYMHEMLYPVLQGVDSHMIANIYGSCDLEVGGSDQTFNMLMGRDVMKMNKQEPQAVLAFDILEGLDGKEKMSKSLDNYVGITDKPSDMFGKIMSIPDSLIVRYFTLCTFTPEPDIEKIEESLKKGKENPKDIKMRLAREIVSIYHGEKEAEKAQQGFVETFSNKSIPNDIQSVKVNKGDSLADVFMSNNVVSSKSELRRLVEGGAIEIMEKKQIVDSVDALAEDGTYRIGKKRFLKITVE